MSIDKRTKLKVIYVGMRDIKIDQKAPWKNKYPRRSVGTCKKNNEREWKMDLLLFCYFRDKRKNRVKHLLLSNAFKVNNDASRMKNKQCSHTKTA